jgi:hypothetical protein
MYYALSGALLQYKPKKRAYIGQECYLCQISYSVGRKQIKVLGPYCIGMDSVHREACDACHYRKVRCSSATGSMGACWNCQKHGRRCISVREKRWDDRESRNSRDPKRRRLEMGASSQKRGWRKGHKQELDSSATSTRTSAEMNTRLTEMNINCRRHDTDARYGTDTMEEYM